MKLSTMKKFNPIRKKFINENYDLETISGLVERIGLSIIDLDEKEFTKLSEIPISILEDDIYMKDYKIWGIKNKDWILNNLNELREEEYFSKLIIQIRDDKYCSSKEIIKIIEYIRDNFNQLINTYESKIRFALNFIEKFIKDSDIYDQESFKSNGDLFAKYIENVMEL
ncbi:UNVERIFIED_ORG: hypothetical protein B2H98_06935 [Clostridium botulinum]